MATKFLRRSSDRYSKLGVRRKKKQVWRKPKGRDNKMREKRRGYPKTVSIGYGNDNSKKNLLMDKKPIRIENLKELEKATKETIIVLGNVGKKNKIEILKVCKEKGLIVYKTNIDKFIKENTKKKAVKNAPRGVPQKSEFGGNKKKSDKKEESKSKDKTKEKAK